MSGSAWCFALPVTEYVRIDMVFCLDSIILHQGRPVDSAERGCIISGYVGWPVLYYIGSSLMFHLADIVLSLGIVGNCILLASTFGMVFRLAGIVLSAGTVCNYIMPGSAWCFALPVLY